MRRHTRFFLTFLILGIVTDGYGETIFQDNFDSQPDWTVNQPTDAEQWKISEGNLPAGWSGYLNGLSYCPGGPGKNNFYIGNTNARGGSGKAVTFWDESCVDYFEDSDGNLGKYFAQAYSEIYIRFYIKFQPGYRWQTSPNDSPQHKLLHVQYYCGSESPWSYFGNPCNMPSSVPGIHLYNGRVWYYVAYRGEKNYYLQGTPSYKFDVGTDMDHVDLGPWSSVLGDGNWHSMEFRYKMNSNSGSTFKADGIHEFWLDGVKKYSATNIPFSDSGSSVSPRRGWNFVSIGGNNNNRWTTSCSGTNCEQWYAVDDVVISTSYIGTAGGSGTQDSQGPAIPQNLKVQ